MSNFWGAHQQLAIAYAEVLYMAQNGDLCTRWPGARSEQGVRRRVRPPPTRARPQKRKPLSGNRKQKEKT